MCAQSVPARRAKLTRRWTSRPKAHSAGWPPGSPGPSHPPARAPIAATTAPTSRTHSKSPHRGGRRPASPVPPILACARPRNARAAPRRGPPQHSVPAIARARRLGREGRWRHKRPSTGHKDEAPAAAPGRRRFASPPGRSDRASRPLWRPGRRSARPPPKPRPCRREPPRPTRPQPPAPHPPRRCRAPRRSGAIWAVEGRFGPTSPSRPPGPRAWAPRAARMRRTQRPHLGRRRRGPRTARASQPCLHRPARTL
mmetsp:Transcript_63329/g.206573  ORF Transcript_63329/g.206573 Transcript_63329/m.206573 type:complete len:255 (-) Transcript_63329:219-983(-)